MDAWVNLAVPTKPAEPWDVSRSWAASDGSMTLSWLPVSTMKSNGPDWLILTGITSNAPATIRGFRPAIFPGQRDSAWVIREILVQVKRTCS